MFSFKASHCWINGLLLGGMVLMLWACPGHQDPLSVQAIGQVPQANSQPANPPPLNEEARARLFVTLCSSCHGIDGRGKTYLSNELSPQPGDFSLCNFKYRSTPSGSLPTDRDLMRTVYIGLPGTAMPSFAQLLSGQALTSLALEIKARCRRFRQEEIDQPLVISPGPAYSAVSKYRGGTVYHREKCSTCHGEQGKGNGPASRTLKDLLGRPILPRDYTQGVFRSGFNRADIYRAFSTGLDGTPMPSLPDNISAEDRWDLTNYLISFSAERNKVSRLLSDGPSWYDPIQTWGLPWR